MESVTIKDIARQAGVSIATVSRVVNKNDYVSEEVEKRVRKVIDELGYVPNNVARSLKIEATLTIGFVVSDIGNMYFTAVAKALEDTIHADRYNLIVCSTEGEKEKELEYLNLLMGKKVDGLVLNTSGKNNEMLADLSHKIPIVLINRKINHINFVGDVVNSNNYDGAYDLASNLLENGHEKIAMINGDLALSTAKERFEGVMAALKEHGISFDQKYYYEGDFSWATGTQGAKYFLELKQPPTAIIAMNNMIAIGMMKYFVNNHIRVPEDISLAVYGNIENSELLFTKPSYVTLNPIFVGKKAGKMLIERIHNSKMPNREIIFTPKLVIGNSVLKI